MIELNLAAKPREEYRFNSTSPFGYKTVYGPTITINAEDAKLWFEQQKQVAEMHKLYQEYVYKKVYAV